MAANYIESMANRTVERPASGESRARQLAARLPSLTYVLAAGLLLASIALPYWNMTLLAPQYPGGLYVRVFVNRMTGDDDPVLDEVREIDNLNHYIGMRPLAEAAQFERSIAVPALLLLAGLLVVAAFWRRRWGWLLVVPPLLFPIVFLADMAYWLNNFGQNLDPYAPFSSAIQPFTPPILGEGLVGQFRTIAALDTGWFLATAGSLLILAGLVTTLVQARRGHPGRGAA
ncbi:MAG: cytochrome C [Anaerolineae bacterium]|nr:cytochrome C [Anaerolineae bacterium]